MSRYLLAVAALAAALAVLAASSASAAGGSLIRLTLPGTKSTYVDLGRKGYSEGDYFLSTGRLVDAATGKPAGRIGGVWTILSRQADNTSFNLGLNDGTIFVTGHIRHTAPKSTLEVTGGTGRYRGSRGTVTFRYLSQTSAGIDVRLRG
jgi:hypothetical protein